MTRKLLTKDQMKRTKLAHNGGCAGSEGVNVVLPKLRDLAIDHMIESVLLKVVLTMEIFGVAHVISFGGPFIDEFHSRLCFSHCGLATCANVGTLNSNNS